MATRTVYSFTGFPGIPERHLYLHHDGYPTGAAWRFATALRQGQASDGFLNAFLSTQSRAEPLPPPGQAAGSQGCHRTWCSTTTPCWSSPPAGPPMSTSSAR